MHGKPKQKGFSDKHNGQRYPVLPVKCSAPAFHWGLARPCHHHDAAHASSASDGDTIFQRLRQRQNDVYQHETAGVPAAAFESSAAHTSDRPAPVEAELVGRTRR